MQESGNIGGSHNGVATHSEARRADGVHCGKRPSPVMDTSVGLATEMREQFPILSLAMEINSFLLPLDSRNGSLLFVELR